MTLIVALSLLVLGIRAEVCELYRTTGYVASEFPGLTADGTSTLGALARGEQIAAGSWNLPLGTYVEVDGYGIYRIADRGYLDARHVDLLVSTRAEAFEVTGYRQVCVVQGGAE